MSVQPTPQKELDELKRTSDVALKWIQAYYDKATKSQNKFKAELEQSKQLLHSLVPVWELCQKQLQAIDEFKKQLCGRHASTLYQVDQVYEYYKKTVTNLEEAFIKLKQKRLHPSLLQNGDETQSLLDWVSLEEVSQMQKEAYNEMAEMQKLAVFLRRTVKQLTIKHDYISQMFTHLDPSYSEFTSYHKVARVKLQAVTEAQSTISAILLDFTGHDDRVQYFLARSSSGDFQEEDFSRLKTASTDLKAHSIRATQCMKQIDAMKQELNTINAVATKVILQCKQLVFLIDFFGHECNKKSKNLVQVQTMWKEHCQGYEGLFVQINGLVNSYNKCLVSYDEMLIEIGRRREYLRKQEEWTIQMQRDLDRAYEEEFRARESFRQSWAIFLPPICPALDEILERGHVFPPAYKTSLPEIPAEVIEEVKSKSKTKSSDKDTLSTTQTNQNNEDKGGDDFLRRRPKQEQGV